MAFIDLFPSELPSERHQEIVGGLQRVTGEPVASVAGVQGLPGRHRMIFRAMEVPGFPDVLSVGAVQISQGPGPVRTQVTQIRQTPGLRPTFRKNMTLRLVGAGEFLTLAERDVPIPKDLTAGMNHWRDASTAAIALVAAVLDERVAQEPLAEDLIIFDASRSTVVAAVDHVVNVRTFQSANRMLDPHRRALAAIGTSIDIDGESPVMLGARWYLRAAQLGPTADAVVFLWTAIEALTKPPWGAKLSRAEASRSDVAWVELALGEAGVDPRIFEPTIGRMAGVRAEVVHGGRSSPALLRESYYNLEQIARFLLRNELGLGILGWPVAADRSNLKPPMRQLAEHLHGHPVTKWEE